jgi:hypothetical protein
MRLPRHSVWPGAQTPWQLPLTQVWLLHAIEAVQPPLALQV